MADYPSSGMGKSRPGADKFGVARLNVICGTTLIFGRPSITYTIILFTMVTLRSGKNGHTPAPSSIYPRLGEQKPRECGTNTQYSITERAGTILHCEAAIRFSNVWCPHFRVFFSRNSFNAR